MRTAKADSSRFLDPETLRQLQHVSLTSRALVEGSMTGSHRSPYKGLSTEFADHRQYVKGDDLKHLDWRVYARTERYYIKRFEESTNLKAYILVDCSASMGYGSNGVTKYEYACRLAAGLAYVVIKQADSAGMVLFGERIEDYFPPRSSLTHLRAMLDALAGLRPRGKTNTAAALHGMAEMIKRRGLIIVISDLLDEPDEVIRGLAHFRQKRHDVIVLQVLQPFRLRRQRFCPPPHFSLTQTGGALDGTCLTLLPYNEFKVNSSRFYPALYLLTVPQSLHPSLLL